MAKTIAQMAERVLRALNRLPDGQTATGSQKKQVSDVYDEIYQELTSDGIVDWLSTDNIPDEVFNPIKILILDRIADDFNVPNRWAGQEKAQKLAISRIIQPPYTPKQTQFEDF